MTDIHQFDQTLAEASEHLDRFVADYTKHEAEYGETENLLLLSSALADQPTVALATLLAVAVRRMAGVDQS